MSDEIIDGSALVVADSTDYLPAVADIDQAIEVYDKIREEAKKRLVKGTDFGVIPGTQKPTLLQPGADKLNNFFGLSSEVVTVERELSIDKDWAYYKAKATLRLKKSGNIVAVAEASINSQETKYFYQIHPDQHPNPAKRVYEFGKKKGQPKEPVRLPDLLNTLEAMAHKRAYVKATRHAHGLSDLYTQDTEDMPAETLGDNKAKPQRTTEAGPDEVINFGKFKGMKWSDPDVEDSYLEWIADQDYPSAATAKEELKRRKTPVDETTGEVKDDSDASDKEVLADWISTFAKDHPDITERVTENKDHRYTDRVFLMTFGLGWMKGKQAQLQQALDAPTPPATEFFE